MKQDWKPGTMIYPLPAAMISCGSSPDEHNIITVSWVGTICTDPPMCFISVRPSRHSYEIIKRTGEYVINLTTEALARATDWCGVRSGKDFPTRPRESRSFYARHHPYELGYYPFFHDALLAGTRRRYAS
mgnify:CR=1 FL=1